MSLSNGNLNYFPKIILRKISSLAGSLAELTETLQTEAGISIKIGGRI